MVSRKESPYGAIFTNNPFDWPKRCVHRCLCSVQHFGKKIMNLITKFKFMNVYSRHFTADLIRYVMLCLIWLYWPLLGMLMLFGASGA